MAGLIGRRITKDQPVAEDKADAGQSYLYTKKHEVKAVKLVDPITTGNGPGDAKIPLAEPLTWRVSHPSGLVELYSDRGFHTKFARVIPPSAHVLHGVTKRGGKLLCEEEKSGA